MSPAAKPSVNAERRVRRAIQRAERDGTEVTVAAIARAADVDRTFLYRRPDLLAAIQEQAAGRGDRYDRTVPVAKLSENIIGLVNEARGEMPAAQWIRVAVLEKLALDLDIPLADLETARRAAPRRANYSKRRPVSGTAQLQRSAAPRPGRLSPSSSAPAFPGV